MTPLHAAAYRGYTSAVALLLATPGVDPLAKTAVRGAQRWLRGLPAVLSAPRPSPLLQEDETPLDWAKSAEEDAAAAAALLRADPRVAAALAHNA